MNLYTAESLQHWLLGLMVFRWSCEWWWEGMLNSCCYFLSSLILFFCLNYSFSFSFMSYLENRGMDIPPGKWYTVVFYLCFRTLIHLCFYRCLSVINLVLSSSWHPDTSLPVFATCFPAAINGWTVFFVTVYPPQTRLVTKLDNIVDDVNDDSLAQWLLSSVLMITRDNLKHSV